MGHVAERGAQERGCISARAHAFGALNDAGSSLLRLLDAKNRLRLLRALVFYGCCIAAHMLAAYMRIRTAPEGWAARPALPDARDALPAGALGDALKSIVEVAVQGPTAVLVALVLSHIDQRSLDALRTFAWLHGGLLVARAVCFTVTLLPDASGRCEATIAQGYPGFCFDLIFSGHAVLFTLCTCVALHFYDLRIWARALLVAYVPVACVLVVAARAHYTVDVVLGVHVTAATFVAWTHHPATKAL